MNISPVNPSVPTYSAPAKTSLKGSEWSGNPAAIVELSGQAVARSARADSSSGELKSQMAAISDSHEAARVMRSNASAAASTQARGINATSAGRVL